MATVSKHVFGNTGDSARAVAPQVTSVLEAARSEPDYMDFPCSVAQERFWLLDRLEPGNASYNVAVRWRLEGRVSTHLLESAWHEIIVRHEVLRSRFLEIEGKPVQRVAAVGALKIVEIDLTSLPEKARSEEGDRIGLIEARAPFDVSTGPLIRVVLLRYSSTSAVILVTTHQIVSDGWSIGIMAREMGAIYRDLALGSPPSLQPLTLQYGDYAKWQLEWLRQRGIDAETEYWSRQLAGVAAFQVPPDRPRPAVPTTNGAIASIVLPRDLTDRMHSLSADCGVTLFVAAVSTLCATLARYTARDEIVMGTQVSDRDQVELEPMIGQFVNSLILRSDLSGDPRFTELLERTNVTISGALENRNIPIERLLGMVKAGHAGSDSPAVSVNFIFQRTFIENCDYGEFALVDMPSLPAGAIYDLNFFMVERPDGWRFSCQYNTDQFEGTTANRLLRYFQSVLESAVTAPARRLSELRLADPGEVRQLLGRLAGPAVALPDGQTIGGLIAAQAGRTPDTVAVVYDDQHTTFSQLEAAAERFASVLRERGITPAARVGIQLPRSLDLVIAILGVWKSGATYVALNPAHPPEVTQRLVDISGVSSIVTSRTNAPTLRASLGVLSDVAASPASSHPQHPATPLGTDPAAVWFSNAAAETPIPVQIPHRALLNVVSSLRDRLGFTANDAFAALGPNVPETLPVELLLPLICGARVILATHEQTVSAGNLKSLIKQSRPTMAFVSRDTSSALLDAMPAGHKLARILCDRATVGPASIARLIASGSEIWALQSHPEASGCVSLQRVRAPHDLRLLGEPLANTLLRVLDGNLKPPPVGARGNLYVGGNNGFIDDSVQEQSGLFIVDPADEGGERLFKTGDEARLRDDGTVEIIAETSHRDALLTEGPEPVAAAQIDPEMESRVIAIWAELLGTAQIHPDANFFELGGHSLLAARMLARVESAFGRRITLANLFRAPTVRGLVQLLHSDARDFDFRQMVKLQADGANLPLIAINNTGVYYLLAKRLGPQQPVTSLQVFDPAAKHESLPQTLEEIAAEYVTLIRRVHPNGPYVLAGWCVAGALAFEIARQLTASNSRVANLFLLDSWLPGYFSRLPPLRRLICTYTLRWQLTRADWKRYKAGHQTLTKFLTQRPSVQKFREWLQSAVGRRTRVMGTGTIAGPEDYDKWLLEYLQSRTNRYVPQPYSGRVTLFRSRLEPTGWLFDPLAGWGSVAAGVDLELVDGNHFTMFQDPGATQMAARMGALIEKVAPERGDSSH